MFYIFMIGLWKIFVGFSLNVTKKENLKIKYEIMFKLKANNSF